MWLALYFHICWREIILVHIEDLIYRKEGKKVSILKCIIISTVIFVVFFMAQIIAFIIVNNTFDVPEIWITNMNNKCGTSP